MKKKLLAMLLGFSLMFSIRVNAQTEEERWDDITLMACCMQAECGGEDDLGVRMVASCIINRVNDPSYPNSVEGVITQKGQFSSYWNGAMNKVGEIPERIVKIAEEIYVNGSEYPDIIYFTAGRYSKYGEPLFKHGGHYFSGKGKK